MYTKEKDSPLNLHLDEENPRFRISINPSQNDIREYMLANEDVLKLAAKMVKMNTVLPGERIIIYNESGKNIVLEGNRRTCIYQMFLNRSLIPDKYQKSFPIPSESFIDEIKEIDLDVVKTRTEAMAYLAARHIEGVKTWSSLSKWRVSFEYYLNGYSINEIADTLVLPINTIKMNICNQKILLRGINNTALTADEIRMLSPLELKPDKLVRVLRLSETTSALQLYFDENFKLKSSIYSDKQLDDLILTLTKKAFIDGEINTRSTFDDIQPILISLDLGINKSPINNEPPIITSTSTINNEKTTKVNVSNVNQDSGKNSNGCENSDSSKSNETNVNNNISSTSNEISIKSSGGNKNVPYFFDGLQYGHFETSNPLTHGISRICNEIRLFSNKKLVSDYPLSAAFLTRSLIEHSIIFYSKTHNIQGQNKLIWDQVSDNGNAPKLSEIIKRYNRNLPNFITDSKMQEYFSNLFSNYNDYANPLNWVVHRPEEFVLPSTDLIQLPGKGLLFLINFLIS